VSAPDERLVGRWLAAAILVSLAGGVGLAFVLYGMPAAHWSSWGANAGGARHFARALGLTAGPVGEGAFVARMRLCLATAWFGYGAALVLGRGGRGPQLRSVRAVGALAALGLAVLMPPALSCDVYGYVAFARLPVVHGLNPYTHTQLALRALGDPVGPFLQWDLPSPYGPLWTELSMALVAPLQGTPLYAQVLAFKLLAGAALVGLAAVGAQIAERLSPGRGALAALAIGLNPMLLIEGPGNGHNDLVFLLPLLACVLWLLRGRFVGAAALLGLSIAIKLVSVVALPWLLLLPAVGTNRRRLTMVVVALAPVVLLQLPFGTAGSGLVAHLLAHAGPGSTVGGWLKGRWVLALVWAMSCVWVRRRACVPALMTAWVAVATATILLGLDAWYPWYFSWPLALALVRWERRSLAVAIASNVLALTMLSFYAR
jgi:hypothetical protein